jgi:DNA-binding beta-propeller fold protein YncE
MITNQGAGEIPRYRLRRTALVAGLLLCATALTADTFDFTTIAGRPRQEGWADGFRRTAAFFNPNAMAVSPEGMVYISDSLNNLVRVMTPDRRVYTLAGQNPALDLEDSWSDEGGDGQGYGATFEYPAGLALVAAGNLVVADCWNHTLRLVTPLGRVVTLAGRKGQYGHADGIGEEARFSSPFGLVADRSGNVFVTELDNHTIRKVTPIGEVITIAGRPGVPGFADGYGRDARFREPSGIAIDGNGNLFVADKGNHLIRKIAPDGKVSTYAGSATAWGSVDGSRQSARFWSPCGLLIDPTGSLLVADETAHVIRRISPDGLVSTLAGAAFLGDWADGSAEAVRFFCPSSLALDVDGSLLVADAGNHIIRRGVHLSEAPSPLGLSIRLEGGRAQLVLTGAPDAYVTVEYRDGLNDEAGWQELKPVVLENGTAVMTDDTPSASGHRFYRLRR